MAALRSLHLFFKCGGGGNSEGSKHYIIFPSLFCVKIDIGKKNSQDNRNYLRMWSQENKSKAKNAKDLPKLNQVSVVG